MSLYARCGAAFVTLLLASGCRSGIGITEVEIPRPVSESSCLAIGFLGGRDAWDDESKGIRQLALELRPEGRNAKTHLTKQDASEFTKRFRSIKTAWTPEVAASQFEELCDRFDNSSPTFVKELRKKRPHYLAFLKYPDGVRRTLSTTNAVEAINKQLEILRRNSGGYFHSEDTAKLKLGIVVTSLEAGKWHRVAATVKAVLDQFNALFEERFEVE